ncbi:hypothetical protein PWW31_04180 [Vibrio harveyi]|nr:hypothetical protein PWW31_04180 [Vibrio harveyi]
MLFINKIKNRLSINKLTKLEQLTLKKLVLLVGKFKEYDEQKGIILIECLLRTPKNNIEKFLITKTILENESLEAVSLVKHSYLKSNKAYHIFRQLGVKRFYSIESAFLNLFILVRSFIKSCAFFISTKDGSDIVNYKINDILIGDLLYDSIIRENDKVFTVGNLKPFRDFTLVFKMFIYFFYYNSLTDRLNIKYYITSHKTYLQYGILCKLVKSKGGVVILKDVNLLKIYDKDPIEAHIMAPDYHLVKSNLNNVEFRNSAEKYIIDRFNANAENMDIDVISAFKNKNNYSKEDLLRVFELNSDSKFVFVMPHAFSDSPHVGTGMLFNDYFEWLVETLKAISKNDNYHIFIKPHPTSYCWGKLELLKS